MTMRKTLTITLTLLLTSIFLTMPLFAKDSIVYGKLRTILLPKYDDFVANPNYLISSKSNQSLYFLSGYNSQYTDRNMQIGKMDADFNITNFTNPNPIYTYEVKIPIWEDNIHIRDTIYQHDYLIGNARNLKRLNDSIIWYIRTTPHSSYLHPPDSNGKQLMGDGHTGKGIPKNANALVSVKENANDELQTINVILTREEGDTAAKFGSNNISGFCFDNNKEYVYLGTRYSIYRLKLDALPEENIELVIKLPTSNGYINSNSLEFDGLGNLWLMTGQSSIVKYNPITNLLVTFNDKTTNDKYKHPLFIFSNFYSDYWMSKNMSCRVLGNKYNNAILATISCEDRLKDTIYNIDTIYNYKKIYWYEDGIWDTLPLPNHLFSDRKDGGIGHSWGLYGWKFWQNEDHIAFPVVLTNESDSFDADTNANDNESNNLNVLILNLVTKEWKRLILEKDDDIKNSNFSDIAYFNNKIYFSQADARERIYVYDPSDTVGIKDTDDGIFQEIGFRNVYPNPTAYRTTTAEIMCYVRDFSKLDIGLYNTIGEKILDLNSDYEYNDATKTIYTTIKLPSNYPDGIYYLNIRNGSERRTQGVIFGNVSK